MVGPCPAGQNTGIVKGLHVGEFLDGRTAGVRNNPAVCNVNMGHAIGFQATRNQPKLGATRQESQTVLAWVGTGHAGIHAAALLKANALLEDVPTGPIHLGLVLVARKVHAAVAVEQREFAFFGHKIHVSTRIL